MCARGRFCSLIPGLGVKFFVIIIAGLLFSPGEVVTASMMGDGLIVLPGAPDPSPGVSRINFFAVQGIRRASWPSALVRAPNSAPCASFQSD